jgi:uncharacterized protein YidB (DUF937 family)
MSEGLGGLLGGLGNLGNLSNLLGGSGGELAGKLLPALLKVVQSQGGGLGGLLSKFTQSSNPAVAQKAQSWVGTGENHAATGDDVEQALGADTVAQVAQEAGVSHDDAKNGLAEILPGLIDKISPDGKLPDLGALGGQLGKLLGGLGH